MTETPHIPPEPANLRLLRRLVTLLLVVMIAGFLTLIALIVMRFSDQGTKGPVWPDTLAVPDGATVVGLSKTPEFYALITDQNQILIYDLNSDLIQTLDINPR